MNVGTGCQYARQAHRPTGGFYLPLTRPPAENEGETDVIHKRIRGDVRAVHSGRVNTVADSWDRWVTRPTGRKESNMEDSVSEILTQFDQTFDHKPGDRVQLCNAQGSGFRPTAMVVVAREFTQLHTGYEMSYTVRANCEGYEGGVRTLRLLHYEIEAYDPEASAPLGPLL